MSIQKQCFHIGKTKHFKFNKLTVRSIAKNEENKSRNRPKSRLQLINELTQFQNTINCREIHCSFTW